MVGQPAWAWALGMMARLVVRVGVVERVVRGVGVRRALLRLLLLAGVAGIILVGSKGRVACGQDNGVVGLERAGILLLYREH